MLNGTSRTGLARLAARLLRAEGLDVIAVGNADTTIAETRVIVRRETVVPREVDEVWRLVSDPAQLPRWWPGVSRVEDHPASASTGDGSVSR